MNELAHFDKIQAELQVFVKPALELTVVNEDDSKVALTTAKTVKEYYRRVEEVRDSLVRPLNEKVKEINAYAKKITGPLIAAEQKIKSEMIEFERALEAERIALAQKQREEQAKREAEAKAKLDAEREEAETLAMFAPKEEAQKIIAQVNVTEERVQTELAIQSSAERAQVQSMRVSGATKRWTFKVTDEAKIPREFLVVNEKAIREAIRTGTREIAGVEIFQELGLAIR